MLDKRLNVYRDDIAADILSDEVSAPRYKTGETFQAKDAVISLHREPNAESPIDTQMLFGETIKVYENENGWSWVQLEDDGYVGYVKSSSITKDHYNSTHYVKCLRTYIYPKPDIKSPPLQLISIGSKLAVTEEVENFYQLASGGYVFKKHTRQIGRYGDDFVQVANRFHHAPYLWGGKSGLGLDCSGLVQLSMIVCGLKCPRDSDMQEAEVGKSLKLKKGLSKLTRGDLVFWKGHVGIMKNPQELIHANAFHMRVVKEPLGEAIGRIKATGGGDITSIKRPKSLGNPLPS